MNHRKILSNSITVIIILMTVALLAGCGSSDSAAVNSTVESEEDPILKLQPGGLFTLDNVVAAGWKKSKELSSETLPDATGVWYGFYDQRDVKSGYTRRTRSPSTQAEVPPMLPLAKENPPRSRLVE